MGFLKCCTGTSRFQRDLLKHNKRLDDGYRNEHEALDRVRGDDYSHYMHKDGTAKSI